MEQIPLSEGAKRLLNTVQKELFPILNELKQLLIDIQGVRINFPLYSSKFRKYSNQYEDIAKRFFVVVQKLETPDILFKDLPKNPQDIASYFQFESAIGKNINEGSTYIEIIDRTLDRKRQTIFNSWTLLLAVLAIVISILFSVREKGQSDIDSCLEKSFTLQYVH